VFHSLIVHKRVADPLFEALKRWAVTVYDADDDPFSHFGAMKYDPIYLARISDVNTVSTSKLKEKVPNAKVLVNCLDYSLWGKKKKKPLTVGLVGGASHLSDWRQVKEPLEKILKRYDVRLVVGGYFPGYLRELPVEFIPWRPYHEYPETIREIDILLCPLDDDEYNNYKSGIKAVEGMSQGAVPVCSDHPIYQRVVTHRKNGLLVGDWEEAISLLIENEKLRLRLSVNGQRWAYKHRNIDTRIGEYVRVYSEARTVGH